MRQGHLAMSARGGPYPVKEDFYVEDPEINCATRRMRLHRISWLGVLATRSGTAGLVKLVLNQPLFTADLGEGRPHWDSKTMSRIDQGAKNAARGTW